MSGYATTVNKDWSTTVPATLPDSGATTDTAMERAMKITNTRKSVSRTCHFRFCERKLDREKAATMPRFSSTITWKTAKKRASAYNAQTNDSRKPPATNGMLAV